MAAIEYRSFSVRSKRRVGSVGKPLVDIVTAPLQRREDALDGADGSGLVVGGVVAVVFR
ncbi:hypothetical protein [Halosimplex carlsbadense]|uniref:hypothetical protein n=1 Tax=Halosimplex carlsbadense TaxID=171164 RepID=UPI001872AD41|nr:hypothetical protein [Halosimplex carlsbadense]